MHINARGELGWRALRYVARRMTPDEICDFELHLACDQAAREAVAQAVELAHSVAALHACDPVSAPLNLTPKKPNERKLVVRAQEPAVSQSQSASRWPSAAFAGAMAASLLIAAISMFNFGVGRTRQPQAGFNIQRVSHPHDELSSAWASLDPARVRARAGEAAPSEDVTEELTGDNKDAADAPIPAWMLRGLRGPRWMGDRLPQEM